MYSQGIDLELRTSSFLFNNLDWSVGGQFWTLGNESLRDLMMWLTEWW